MTELDPLRRCERINDELELHYWPVPDPPPGTACTCGKTTRRAAGVHECDPIECAHPVHGPMYPPGHPAMRAPEPDLS